MLLFEKLRKHQAFYFLCTTMRPRLLEFWISSAVKALQLQKQDERRFGHCRCFAASPVVSPLSLVALSLLLHTNPFTKMPACQFLCHRQWKRLEIPSQLFLLPLKRTIVSITPLQLSTPAIAIFFMIPGITGVVPPTWLCVAHLCPQILASVGRRLISPLAFLVNSPLTNKLHTPMVYYVLEAFWTLLPPIAKKRRELKLSMSALM